MLKKTDKILIAGQEGMVGSSLFNFLKKKKFIIIDCKREDLDFLDYNSVYKFFKKKKTNYCYKCSRKSWRDIR